MSKVDVGRFGEKVACIYLSTKGYDILERNWYCRYGEIDVVARSGSRILFVEVKMRAKSRLGDFKDHITSAKLRRLQSSINLYLYSKRLFDVEWRLDGIYIIKDSRTLHLQHFQGIIED